MKTQEAVPVEYRPLVSKSNWVHLSVELTSKCNLRCVYCGKSKDSYNALPGHDEHMADAVSSRIVDLAQELEFNEVNFNGTGEISIFPGWTETIDDFKKRSRSKLYVVTNFAKSLSEEELDAFLKLDRIYISVDTSDRELLMHIRRKVDVRMITHNIARLRQKGILENRKVPWLRFNCVVSDLSGKRLHELAAFAVAVGVDEIEMFPMNGCLNDAEGYPRPPSSLDSERMREIAEQALQAKQLLEAHGKKLKVTEELKRLMGEVHPEWSSGGKALEGVEDSEEEIFKAPKLPEEGVETRLCLQPWRRLLAGADGRVYPCCRKAEVLGNLNEQTVQEVVSDTPLMELRQALLDGNLKGTICRACANAPIGTVEEMQSRIEELVGPENGQ